MFAHRLCFTTVAFKLWYAHPHSYARPGTPTLIKSAKYTCCANILFLLA